MSCQHAFCLTGSGYLASTSTLQLVTPHQFGDFASDGLALMDLDNNRMFLAVSHGIGVNGTVINGTDVNWYDATTYKLVAQYVIPNWTGAYAFQKVVGDQLAIANGRELILLPIAMLQPQ